MTCIMRVGSTSCVPGSSVGSGRRAGWKPCISACGCCGCSGADTSSCAPSSSLFAVPLSMAARTSRSTMRPAGPEPSIFERSRSFSLASLRTMGEALKCPSALPSALPSATWAPPSSVSPSSAASVSVAVAWVPPPASLSPPSSASSSAPPSLRSGTSSPSLLSHLRSVPSSIASPILGMMTSGTLLLLLVHNPAGSVLDLLIAWEGHQLEVARVRPGDLGATHPLYWCVQRIEGPVLDDRRHLTRHPEPPPLLLDGHAPVRLLHRLDDGVLIEGTQGSQVYNLGLEAVLRQRVRNPQAQVDLPAVGDERHVRALAGDAGLAERYGVVAVFHLSLRSVQGAGLQEDHGVGVPYSRNHHALDIVRGDGRHDFQARKVAVEALQRMCVLGRELDATAVGATDHERHFDLAAGEVADLGSVLDDLVRRQEREVPGHHLDDGTHAHHGHADGGADEAVLGDGHVHDALGAVLVVEAVGDKVGAAVDTDILAHQHHVLVVVELVDHRLPKGLAVGLGLRHGLRLPHVLVLARVDVGVELLLRRLLALVGELYGLLYPLLGLVLYLLYSVLVEHVVLYKLVLDHPYGITLTPLLDLFFGAVLLEEVGGAVRGRPVSQGLHRVRLARLPDLLHDPLGHLDDGLHVHAVHLLVLDAVGVELGGEVRHGGGALDRGAHPVLVVLDDEQARALAIFAPEPREVGRLVEGALADGAVAQVELADVVGLLVAHGVRDAHPKGYVPADDAVAAHEPVVHVEEVHGAALALHQPRAPAVELGHDLFGVAA